jgi:hypothetical protein
VDLDIAGRRVGEHHSQLLSWHWPGDDESILPILTSIVDSTILATVNAAITSLPDASPKFEILGVAWRGLMEMMVCMPVILPQSWITILLLAG